MSTVFIYALRCPTSGGVRYVGKTSDPARRWGEHRKSKYKNHLGNWVRSVMATGERPLMEVLDEVPEIEWPMWEVAYIQYFREEGCDLVNGNDGGEGGANPTVELRAKMRAAKLGKKHSPEACAKMSAAKSGGKNPFFGKKLSPEHCAKMSAAMSGEKNHFFGKKLSPEHCAKLSAANLGKPRSAETRAKISVAKLGKKHSPEACAKISAAQTGKPWTPARRAAYERRRVSASFT